MDLVWNTPEVKKTLGDNCVLISIVRDPLEIFLSMWSYYGIEESVEVQLVDILYLGREQPTLWLHMCLINPLVPKKKI